MAQDPPKDRRYTEVRLKYPIPEGGPGGAGRIDVLYVKSPKAKEMRLLPAKLDQGTIGEMHPFAAKVCGVTVAELEELELEDYMAVMAAVGEFVAEFPTLGTSTSPGSPASSISGDPTSSS